MNSILIRNYSSNAPVKRSARLIRKEFLDYFKKDLGHSFIRSSPVVPLNDRTLSFVNAGMNQFKGIFLDYYEPPATKVVNSQKCIRVGGKHNDLSIVGTDSYHHTFFEMLGNWSFGDYFKEDACRYAWDLLTNHYNIKKDFLYVTYFAGNEKLGLEPDLECKDIWLRIGVSKDKILPFGVEDNFWEMGITGPCGPCTEIHVDHTKQLGNQSSRVNKGYADLTELWNIVFIQYERLINGSIVPLSKHHVDTGMGLERLVTLLQEKKSNYDTDLFQPLFQAIQRCTMAPEYKGRFDNDDKDGIDTGYRILADHSRMITATLADGILPYENQKLRRIIRKAINVGENIFNKSGILSELSYTVADSLGEVYPELQNNLMQVRKIIEFEEELFKKLRSTSGKAWKKIIEKRPEMSYITDWMSPGLVDGYKDLQRMLKNRPESNILTGDIAFKLYDTYGLHFETIAELAKIESLHFDEVAFQNELNKAKYRSRSGIIKNNEIIIKKSADLLEKNGTPKTDDSFKYQYSFDADSYNFPVLNSTIVGLIVNDELVLNSKGVSISTSKDTGSNKSMNIDVEENKENKVGIILDKTVCYSSEEEQGSDMGYIHTRNMIFNIDMVQKVDGYVVHFGEIMENNLQNLNEKLRIGDNCMVSINPERRVQTMRNHTATHLLNASLKNVMQLVCQHSQFLATSILKFKFNSFGETLSLEQMKEIEKQVNDVIIDNIPVSTKQLNSLELLQEDSVTFTAGKLYPYAGIRVVEINGNNLKSKEVCMGTHVHNTKAIEYFCFLNYTSKRSLNQAVTAIVGPLAVAAKQAGDQMYHKVLDLENEIRNGKFSYQMIETMISDLNRELHSENKQAPIPYLRKNDCLKKLEDLSKSAWVQAKEVEMTSISNEMKDVIDATFPFIVHCLRQRPTYLSLHEIVSFYPNRPVLIISSHKGTVQARCCIPKEMVSKTFNAENWMQVVLQIFGAKYDAIKGFDALLVASMKSKNVLESNVESLIHTAVTEARNFAAMHMQGFQVDNETVSSI